MRRELQYPIPTRAQLPQAVAWMQEMAMRGLKGGEVAVVLTRPRRTADSNAKLHAMIHDIWQQGEATGPMGDPMPLCERSFDEVKAALVDAFADEKRAMGEPLRHPGAEAWNWISKRFVSVRPSTTQFTKAECSDFIEYLYQCGSEMNVTWSEKAQAVYDEMARAA